MSHASEQTDCFKLTVEIKPSQHKEEILNSFSFKIIPDQTLDELNEKILKQLNNYSLCKALVFCAKQTFEKIIHNSSAEDDLKNILNKVQEARAQDIRVKKCADKFKNFKNFKALLDAQAKDKQKDAITREEKIKTVQGARRKKRLSERFWNIDNGELVKKVNLSQVLYFPDSSAKLILVVDDKK